MAEASPYFKERSNSRIPRLLRSTSFHGTVKKNSNAITSVEDETEALDDVGSLDDNGSLSSVCSVASCAVPFSAHRRFGESVYKFGRVTNSPRYSLHCAQQSTFTGGVSEYLTPTQRANKTIRQLKSLLKESEANNHYKDFEIQRLTRELDGLRLVHAAQSFKKAAENEKDYERSKHPTTPSLADSGLFDDIPCHASQFKDPIIEKDQVEVEKMKTSDESAEKIKESMIRQHTNEIQSIKARFTDRLELALTQLGDLNTLYAKLLVDYDQTRKELKETETEQLRLRQQIVGLENKNSQLQNEIEKRERLESESKEKEFLQFESLSQELAEKNQMISELQLKLQDLSILRMPASDNGDHGNQHVSNDLQGVATLLKHQDLKTLNNNACADTDMKQSSHHTSSSTSADPSILLRFLRSAIFYLLTDSENGTEHLRAIQSILEFSPEERCAVERMGRLGYL